MLGDGEECDDGSVNAGDGCSPNCTKEFRRVFITSIQFTGNLGGIMGAHSICQTAAELAGLPGIFHAWLSTTESSPDQDFVKSMVPYVRVDGETVALDWEDLVTGALLAPILLTEFGEDPEPTVYPPTCVLEDIIVVWSDTSVLGKLLYPDASCNGWKEGAQGEGSVGRADTLDSSWTQACKVTCATMAPFYCFEQ